jgi:hypothetical protein
VGEAEGHALDVRGPGNAQDAGHRRASCQETAGPCLDSDAGGKIPSMAKKKKNEDLINRVAAELRAAASALEDRLGGGAKRKAGGKKAAATRKRNAAKRSTAAKKGAVTRAKAKAKR